jgi:hypothetical protein
MTTRHHWRATPSRKKSESDPNIDPAPHLGYIKLALKLNYGETDAIAGSEHLADHDEDQPDGQGLPGAGCDLRPGPRQDEMYHLRPRS